MGSQLGGAWAHEVVGWTGKALLLKQLLVELSLHHVAGVTGRRVEGSLVHFSVCGREMLNVVFRTQDPLYISV